VGQVLEFVGARDQRTWAALAQSCKSLRVAVNRMPVRRKIFDVRDRHAADLERRLRLQFALHVLHVWVQGPVTALLLLLTPLLVALKLNGSAELSTGACMAPLIVLAILQCLVWLSISGLFQYPKRWWDQFHHLDGLAATLIRMMRWETPLDWTGTVRAPTLAAEACYAFALQLIMLVGLVIGLLTDHSGAADTGIVILYFMTIFVFVLTRSIVVHRSDMRTAGVSSPTSLLSLHLLSSTAFVMTYATTLLHIGWLHRNDDETIANVRLRWMHGVRGPLGVYLSITTLAAVIAFLVFAVQWCVRTIEYDLAYPSVRQKLRCWMVAFAEPTAPRQQEVGAWLEPIWPRTIDVFISIMGILSIALLVATTLVQCTVVGGPCHLLLQPHAAFDLPSDGTSPFDDGQGLLFFAPLLVYLVIALLASCTTAIDAYHQLRQQFRTRRQCTSWFRNQRISLGL
jgi:hypothetical protein